MTKLNVKSTSDLPPIKPSRSFLWLLVLLVLVLSFLFINSFSSDLVLFSNDCPLGYLTGIMPENPFGFYFGHWVDLNWLGASAPIPQPGIIQAIYTFMWPVLWHDKVPLIAANFLAPISLGIVGISIWIFFRALKFSPAVCILAALAGVLNSNIFSNTCWGLIFWAECRAMMFLALAALVSIDGRHTIIKLMLAGTATGMCVMAGFDLGAIHSLYIATFVLFLCLNENKTVGSAILKGGGRLAIVVIVSLLVAAQAISTLFETQIKGVAGVGQDQQAKDQRWDFATQWSLPKAEVLRIIIPGLFGYRMDTPDGGIYWGTVGQQPGWEQHRQGLVRYSGSGEYAGVLVAIIAMWAFLQSLRNKTSPYSERERKIIWFWAGAALISLALALGRNAPFYRFFYMLPYVSTIRNPIKFMHLVHLGLGILFGFGLEGLARLYLNRATNQAATLRDQMASWWATSVRWDKRWFIGLTGFIAISFLGFLIYLKSKPEILGFLQKTGMNVDQSASIVKFSNFEICWYLLFLSVSTAILALIVSGYWSGTRAKRAWIALGLVMVLDLVRANSPWVIHYNHKNKYATNPVVDLLRQKPYEARVKVQDVQLMVLFDAMQGAYSQPQIQQLGAQFSYLLNLYRIEWAQHLFPFYKIQSLDVVQERSQKEDDLAFRKVFPANNAELTKRMWELTNTRYLLGVSGEFIKVLNRQFDPEMNRFRLHTAFDISLKNSSVKQPQLEDLTVVVNSNGALALIEFTGALPRAKLYSQWQAVTNKVTGVNPAATRADPALELLADLSFNPHQTVVVSDSIPPAPATTATNAGTIEFSRYSPRHIILKAYVQAPSVLLLNDKYDPHWQVKVDGQRQPLLRCNYLMRGVMLQPGQFNIEFEYLTSTTPLFLSLSAIVSTLILGLVLLNRKQLPSATTIACSKPDR